ncbi:MAG: holin [Prevotella sp.]|nr:holin [Prevotella sp.]
MNKEFWKAAGVRAIRTFLQVILAVWTAGQLITEVDWKFVILSAFSSAVYSLLTSILAGLPEVNLTDTLYALDNDPYDEDDDIEEE